MTEAELMVRETILQSSVALGDLQSSHIAIYLTLIFAYMSFAYLAGRELSKVQLSAVTVVFLAATIFEVIFIVNIGAAAELKRNQLAEYSNVDVINLITSGTLWDGIIVWSLGIVAACLFMWDRRRQ